MLKTTVAILVLALPGCGDAEGAQCQFKRGGGAGLTGTQSINVECGDELYCDLEKKGTKVAPNNI